MPVGFVSKARKTAPSLTFNALLTSRLTCAQTEGAPAKWCAMASALELRVLDEFMLTITFLPSSLPPLILISLFIVAVTTELALLCAVNPLASEYARWLKLVPLSTESTRSPPDLIFPPLTFSFAL